MSQPSICPECGAELPSGALGGLCPKCLLAAGLESRAEPGNAVGGSGAPTTPHSAGFTPPDVASLAAHFPQLEILELLGHGGMGAVYKARQPKLDRLVALKIIRPESADDPAFAERFNREARMLARLSHPHIVPVYDFGEVSFSQSAADVGPRTLYFFLMEYVEGTNLRQLLQTGELLPHQALAIVPQICEALQFAHDEGVVHRDIKPENILLDKRGRVKIADFGLAKLAAGSPDEFTLTGTHQVMGTPRYMAPEQMEGSHAVDHRADIYSLGVVFYEMLTGEVPMGHFEAPSKKVEVDVRLDEVVLRALAREPKRRYQHASDVKTDVEQISQIRAEPSAEHEPGMARVGRHVAPGVAHGVEREVIDSRSIQGPADALLVIGSLALLTAIGVGLWLWLSPTAPLMRPPITHNLTFAGISYFVYSLFIITAAFLMRRLLARAFALLSVTIVGIAYPVMIALNVIMQREISPEWPVGLPMWLGVPIAAWATSVLFRTEVRDAFRRQRETRTHVGKASQQPGLVAKRDIEWGGREIGIASAEVRAPAMALTAVGVFEWIACWTAAGIAGLAFREQLVAVMGSEDAMGSLLLTVVLLGAILSTVVILAGLAMRRLESRAFCVFGSLVAMLISPGNVIGLPIGIWSLYVLTRPEVKAAFLARKHRLSGVMSAGSGQGAAGAARAPQRPHQHAGEVKADVESISVTVPPLARRKQLSEVAVNDAELSAARQQVQPPVVGLLVLGVLSLPLAARAFLSRYGSGTLSESPEQVLFWLAYFLPPLATLVGAVKMLQLSSYRWAIAASLLVVLSPGVLEQRQAWWIWWLCVLVGIWSLVVLSRPDVKRGFASRTQRTPDNPARVDRKGGLAQELGSQSRVPKLIYILGILQLLLGLLMLTGVGVGLMFADVEPDEEWLASNQAFREWGKIHTAVEPWISGGLAYLLLASGIGLLLGRRWGRTLALTYAVGQLTWGIASWPLYVASMGSLAREVSAPFDADERVMISSAVIGMLFLCASEIIYPLVVLVLLNTARIRSALAKRAAPNASHPLPTESAREVASLVLNPAWGLIITGIISWVTIPLAFWGPAIQDLNSAQRTIFQITFAVIPLVVGTIMALAGYRMKRLEGYRMAMFAAILPIAVLLFKLVGLSFGTLGINPADWVGAPIGLWVLVVLTRSNVKAAFHRPRPQGQSGHVKTDLESSGSRRDELTPYGDASSKTVFEDFLLMNPRLPVAARWITVYAIVVRPLLWILVVWLGFLGIMSSLAGDHPESAIEHIVDVVAGVCGLVLVVIVALGGVKLRALRHNGPRWIKIGLGLGFGFGLLMFIVHLTFVPWFVGPLRWAARHNPELLVAEGFSQEEIAALVADKMHPILIPDAISAFFVLLWLALDIAVFVWLWRNSRFLPESDAKALPGPKPVEAAPAGPISEKQRGTLGRAWDEWWAERDRWFTRTVLTVLLLVHIGCLAMFLTLRGGGGYDSGRPSAWHHVGWPTPWFVYERGVEANVAFRRTINLLSSSGLIAAVAMLAWYAFWRVQLVRDARNARFWRAIGSPTAVLIAWIIAAAAFSWLGVRAADRLYESMPKQSPLIGSPQPAEVPGS